MRKAVRIPLRSLAMVVLLLPFLQGDAHAHIFTVQASAHSVVHPNNGLNTGINLALGKVLVIDCDRKDTWSIDPNPGFASNANGSGNPFGAPGGFFTIKGHTFRSGSLVGSLDGGVTFFPVGTKMEMTILRPGMLRLYFWDVDHANNVGSVQVHVEVYTGP